MRAHASTRLRASHPLAVTAPCRCISYGSTQLASRIRSSPRSDGKEGMIRFWWMISRLTALRVLIGYNDVFRKTRNRTLTRGYDESRPRNKISGRESPDRWVDQDGGVER